MSLLASSSLGGGSLVPVLVLALGAWALAAYPLFHFARRTRDHAGDAWFAWVPILSTVLLCRVARVSAWWMLVLVASVVPVLGTLVALAFTVTLWVRIGRRFGATGRGVVAALVPVLGTWIFAFSVDPDGAR